MPKPIVPMPQNTGNPELDAWIEMVHQNTYGHNPGVPGILDGDNVNIGLTPHASNHENGGVDEIDVTGLSGLLADQQTPLAHAANHASGGSDEVDHGGLPGLTDDDHQQYILVNGTRQYTGTQEFTDNAANAPIRSDERSAEPSTPISGDKYVDDGTNTTSGQPGWRQYNGATWEDLGALMPVISHDFNSIFRGFDDWVLTNTVTTATGTIELEPL